MSRKLKIGHLLFILMATLFIVTGCAKQEEILPAPSRQEETQSLPQGELREEETPQPSYSSELYQYGYFPEMPYRILIPRNFDSTKTYPLHIFLHGRGERGTDNEQQLIVGASYFQEDSVRKKYPAFVVLPQCPKTRHWFDDWSTEKVKGLIDDLLIKYPVNEQRISIGGLSMGAYGTFAIVARYPLFQAAIAISGGGEDQQASLMSHTRWRIFAGKDDQVVSSSESKRMAVALENAGASVTFTLYNQADHSNTWIKAFSEPDFFSWLFSEQTRQ